MLKNIKFFPVCEICKIELQKEKKYNKTCSKTCSLLLRTQTTLKKYGVENISQLKEIKEKKSNLSFEKYGKSSIFETEDYKNRMKEQFLETYGVDNVSKSPLIVNKIKETKLKKYGKENNSQTEENKEKVKNTILKKHGVEHFFQSDLFKTKTKETNIKKYGSEYASTSIDIKNKKRNNSLKEYGSDHVNQKHYKNMNNFNVEFILNNFLNKKKQGLLFAEMLNYFNMAPSTLYRKIRENMELKELMEYNIINSSKKLLGENEIYDFVKSILDDLVKLEYIKQTKINKIDINVLKNKRNVISTSDKKLELDIYIPELKLAIEYNGLLYHSFGIHKTSRFNNLEQIKLKKDNLQLKTDMCEEKGIKLFHINEDEWLDPIKKEIWKRILKNYITIEYHKLNNFQSMLLKFENCVSLNEGKLLFKDVLLKNDEICKEFLTKNNLDKKINDIYLEWLNNIQENKKNISLIALCNNDSSKTLDKNIEEIKLENIIALFFVVDNDIVDCLKEEELSGGFSVYIVNNTFVLMNEDNVENKIIEYLKNKKNSRNKNIIISKDRRVCSSFLLKENNCNMIENKVIEIKKTYPGFLFFNIKNPFILLKKNERNNNEESFDLSKIIDVLKKEIGLRIIFDSGRLNIYYLFKKMI
jgi:hypothetical protein